MFTRQITSPLLCIMTHSGHQLDHSPFYIRPWQSYITASSFTNKAFNNYHSINIITKNCEQCMYMYLHVSGFNYPSLTTQSYFIAPLVSHYILATYKEIHRMLAKLSNDHWGQQIMLQIISTCTCIIIV